MKPDPAKVPLDLAMTLALGGGTCSHLAMVLAAIDAAHPARPRVWKAAGDPAPDADHVKVITVALAQIPETTRGTSSIPVHIDGEGGPHNVLRIPRFAMTSRDGRQRGGWGRAVSGSICAIEQSARPAAPNRMYPGVNRRYQDVPRRTPTAVPRPTAPAEE